MARKIIDTDDINKKKLKISVFICNMVIILVCLAAILTMILGHFISISFKMEITKEMMDEIIESSDDDTFEGVDSSVLEGNPIEIDLYFKLSGKIVISSVFNNNEKIIANVVDEQIDIIVEQMKPLFKQVAKAAVQVAVPEVKKQLVDSLKEDPKYQGKTEEEIIKAVEEEYGFSEKSITESFDAVIDELFEENPDREKIKNIIDDTITENTAKAVAGGLMDEADVKELQETLNGSIDKIMEELTDSNGNFDPYILLNKAMDGELDSFLDGILNGSSIPNAGNTTNSFKKVADSSESEALQEFKQKLHDAVPEDLVSAGGLGLRMVGLLYLVCILTWVALIIVTVLKTLLAKNKTVSVFLACFFNFPGHFVLSAIPNLVVKSLPVLLESAEADALTMAIFKSFTISFSSINWVATLCAVILMGGWFYYRLLKKQVKALVRENLIDKSIFEKDDYNPFNATPDFVGATARDGGSTRTLESTNYVKKNGITYYNLYGTKDYDDMDFEETKTQSPVDR